MLLIAPSILAADFSILGRQISLAVDGGADWIHLDVMDGRFVPNISFGPPVVRCVRHATRIPLDVHLMIEEPERYVETFIEAGADIVTVHVEASRHVHRTVQLIHSLGAKAGLALNPGTPVSLLDPILADVDLVLVMSVNPGFGGQSFIPSTVRKIRELSGMIRNVNPFIHLEVDGGIDAGTAPLVVEAGATVLVSGTYVFHSDDIPQAIQGLRTNGQDAHPV